MHPYTPDFLVRRKDGRCLIVEIKSERERDDATNGEGCAKAVATRKWANLNVDKLKYQMIFVRQDDVRHEDLQETKDFIQAAAEKR